MHDEDTEALMKWSPQDLAARLAGDNPDEDSFVLRVVAARLAERAGSCGDPLHVIKDLSRAAGSMAEAARTILGRSIGTEPEDAEELDTARRVVDELDNACASLHTLSNWF